MRRARALIAFTVFGIYLAALSIGTVTAWINGDYEQGFSHERTNDD